MIKRIIIGSLLGALILPAYAAAYYMYGPHGAQILTMTLSFAAVGALIALMV